KCPSRGPARAGARSGFPATPPSSRSGWWPTRPGQTQPAPSAASVDAVNLDPESERLLATARIGMRALNGGRYPLVNPAAFYFGGDSVWLTTSRHAVKFALARRRPGASFLVDGGGHCVLLEG